MGSQYIPDGTVEGYSAFPNTPQGKQRRWIAEIEAACKEAGPWHQKGEMVISRFEDKRDAVDSVDRKFNLFTSNVLIMQAALYSRTPKPEVRRKFDDPNDDEGRVAALLVQRAVAQDLDDPPQTFSGVMSQAVQDWLVPGLGAAWLRLRVETTTQNDPTLQADYEVITEEEIVVEHVHWKDLIWSPCRTWEDRRWTARRVYLGKEEVIKRFGAEKEKQVSYSKHTPKNTDPNDPCNELFSKAEIFEIWDRTTRTVYWVNKGMNELLDEREDPLKLTMFEPMPKPLFALQTTSNSIPVPDFCLSQDQYRELDELNNRISLLVKACKVIGVYDQSQPAIQRMLTEGFDNTLIPVDNWAMFGERGGVKGAVDWLPLEQVVQAIQQLNLAREAVKQQIYELTGISDIVRGATRASETLGAQELKAKFASVRIQTRQQEVARFASEILQIKAEMMLKHMQPDTVLDRAGVSYLQEPPELINAAVRLIQDHKQYEWRITIQSDSMAQIDYAQEKADRIEFVGTMGNFISNALPMAQQAPQLLPMAVAMIKFAASGFSISKEIEGIMDRVLDGVVKAEQERQANPPPPPPDPAMIKAEADVKALEMKTQATVQSTMMKTNAQIQAQNAKTAAQIQADRAKLGFQAELQRDEHEVKKEGQRLDMALRVQDQAASQALAEQNQEHAQRLAEQEGDGEGDETRADTAPATSSEDKKLEAMMQAITLMAQAVTTIAESINAPKRVVRDNMGRAIGVEVVTNGRVRNIAP